MKKNIAKEVSHGNETLYLIIEGPWAHYLTFQDVIVRCL